MRKSIKKGLVMIPVLTLSLQTFMPLSVVAEDLTDSKMVMAEEMTDTDSAIEQTEQSVVTGWQGTVLEGNRSYVDETGNRLTGLQKIEEKTYFFNEEGVVQTGWQEAEDATYYFSPESGERYESGSYIIDGVTYVFDENGLYEEDKTESEADDERDTPEAGESGEGETPDSEEGDEGETPGAEDGDNADKTKEDESEEAVSIFKGWHYDKGWYYYDGNGNKMYGWQKIGGNWYYLDGNDAERPGVMLADCSRVINGRTYFFEGGGVMLSGWVRCPEGWYYTDVNGAMQTGWIKLGKYWYYLNPHDENYPGRMVANQQMVINGRTYFFEGGGTMQTGWTRQPEGWYYTDENGAKLTGWQRIGKYWYYLDPDNAEHPGLMAVNGKKEINGYTYFFTGGGEMQTGWIKYPEGYYYAHPGGNQQKNGWLQLGKNWYYLDGKNEEYPGLRLENCELTLGKYQYAFKPDGVMRTGWWFKPGEGYHFYDVAGYMRSGWVQTGGKWYYLDPKNNNIMLSNQWYRNGQYWYYLKESGEMATRWLTLYGNKYWLSTDGVMRTGWQTIGGYRYYFYKENDANSKGWGVMAKNTTIDGVPIGSDGRGSMAYAHADRILNKVGWNLSAAFNWSASLPYVNYSNSPVPGSEAMAMYGFQNGVGDCYVMAATFYYMAKVLGYDAHQMAGYVPLLNGGMGVHSWVEIDMNGSTYVFDPNFTSQTGRNGYQIYYGMSGTWRYSNYYRMN